MPLLHDAAGPAQNPCAGSQARDVYRLVPFKKKYSCDFFVPHHAHASGIAWLLKIKALTLLELQSTQDGAARNSCNTTAGFFGQLIANDIRSNHKFSNITKFISEALIIPKLTPYVCAVCHRLSRPTR